jgi:hypothetical protein
VAHAFALQMSHGLVFGNLNIFAMDGLILLRLNKLVRGLVSSERATRPIL